MSPSVADCAGYATGFSGVSPPEPGDVDRNDRVPSTAWIVAAIAPKKSSEKLPAPTEPGR